MDIGVGLGDGRGPSGRRNRGWGALAGILVVLAASWVVVAWPWMLGTVIAMRQGVEPYSVGWYAAGLIPESAYLVLVGLGVGIRLWRKGNRPDLDASWLHKPGEPAALQRWWNGTAWTPHTQWDPVAQRTGSARGAGAVNAGRVTRCRDGEPRPVGRARRA